MKNNNRINPGKNRVLFLSLIFSVLFSFSSSAQRKFKDYLVTGSAMLVSGMLDGTIKSITYHYDKGFKPRFQKVNDQFWNPSISWQNKYKNGNCELGPKFIGSTNIFVATTDAYHMLRTTKRSIDGLTLAYYMNKTCSEKKARNKRWKNIATDFLVLTVIRSIGFNFTYTVLFNPQRSYNKM